MLEFAHVSEGMTNIWGAYAGVLPQTVVVELLPATKKSDQLSREILYASSARWRMHSPEPTHSLPLYNIVILTVGGRFYA
jgi:hypothetical protein